MARKRKIKPPTLEERSIAVRGFAIPPALRPRTSRGGRLAASNSLSASRWPATPACDQTFGTVELVEAILTRLPLHNLLIAMRTCKSFCAIAKTAKSVLRNKSWLYSGRKPSAVTLYRSAGEEGGGNTAEGENKNGAEEILEVRTGRLFKDYLCFTFPKKAYQESFTWDMVSRDVTGGASAAITLQFVYNLRCHISRYDTIITVDPAATDELWRLLPLRDGIGAVNARVYRGHELAATESFPSTSTLGDLCLWLCDQAVTFEESR